MPGSALLVILWAAFALQVTPPPQSLSFDRLMASVPQAPPAVDGNATTAQQLTVRWTAAAGSAATPAVTAGAVPADGSFQVIAKINAGEMPIERHPELSADRLLIAGTDASGAIVAWSLTMDPRVVRAEVPGPDGRLTGRVVYRGSADLLALLPDSSSIVQGAVYQPSWNGSEWSLTLAGTFSLDGAR